MEDELIVVLSKLCKLKDKIDLFNKDYLRTWDKTQEEIDATLLVTRALQILYQRNISTKAFSSGMAVSIFRDNSTRTRSSFASAASLLGLSVLDMDETKSQVSHGETVRETAAMLSFLTQVIGIRDDLFVGEGHKYMKEVSDTVQLAFKDRVIPQIPSVVNLQCDEDHPTQALADLTHLIEYFGGVDNLKGKKLVMSWAYSPSYGKPLSVPQSIIALMTRFGMDVVLAHPEGYDLIPEIVEQAKKNAEKSGGHFTVSHDMKESFVGADVVYPKSWAAFDIMTERCKLLRAGQATAQAVKELDKKAITDSQKYIDWQCTEELMKLTKDGKALYMHCLPADISGVSCTRGEVTAEVFDKYRNLTYKEAGNKPYVIAAMMLLNRFPDCHELIRQFIKRNEPRVFGTY
jgi:knotted carbamoyltransferase YgeW